MNRTMKTLRALSALTFAAALLAPASFAAAYYVETRGTAGAEVPVRWADGNEATAEVVEVEYRSTPRPSSANSRSRATLPLLPGRPWAART